MPGVGGQHRAIPFLAVVSDEVEEELEEGAEGEREGGAPSGDSFVSELQCLGGGGGFGGRGRGCNIRG